MTRIPVYAPYLSDNVRKNVLECIDSGWISSRGAFVEQFESAFANYVGTRDAVSVFNGTVALHLAMSALGLGPGDEVIVPTFTYIASVNTIMQTGATPIFADSLESTLQLDPASVITRITPRTKAIMAVHLYGDCCDMDALTKICSQHDLYLIEDAAEAFGVRWNRKFAGTFGDISTFSFFGNKTITTGEGGMILARDPALLDRCRSLRSQGVSKEREYWHDMLAYNYRMTNIQAAIGLAQIGDAEWILRRKKEIASRYRGALQGLPLRFHDPVGTVDPSYWMCSIILDKASNRDPLRAQLAERNIETRPFFPPAHLMPHCRSEETFPSAEGVSARGINLPSSPLLSDAQIQEVTSAIRDFLQRN